MQEKNAILRLENIEKSYIQGKTKLEVLKNINLDLYPGCLAGIVGVSGSGKSTLLHIAGLLDKPTSGAIFINGNKADSKESAYLRLQYMGFVYQQHHLLSDFSAKENVALPKILLKQNPAKALKEAEDLLCQVGLEDKINNMPSELSGGQQQRVAIARSLSNEPKIILADEPTGNLDPFNAEQVFSLFTKLTKEKNIAVLMVTHNHNLINKMDMIYELKNSTSFLSKNLE